MTQSDPQAGGSDDHRGGDFHVFDTTLRDGAQMEGLRYSVADKLAVAELLDDLGVDYIEGGWPGAIPSDTEFFSRAAEELNFKHAKLVAFGMTRRAGSSAAEDPGFGALLDSRAPVLCLVAKSDMRHVEQALRTTAEENLAMIGDSVRTGREHDRQVFIDCEHFFDGFRSDPEYATLVVRTALEAGAEAVVLCDTNGGRIPSDITEAVTELRRRLEAVLPAERVRLGMHAQNDTGCAVANTLAAVQAGVMHVQGTANGYGERPGNANLFSVIANLETKLGRKVLPDGGLGKLTRISHAIAEIANMTPDEHAPYTGHAAFAHKAGIHASAIKADPALYNHVDPVVVGNDMRILVTEMAGRASVELKGRELGIDLSGDKGALDRITGRVKELESKGWSFEAADASFELLVRDEVEGGLPRPFALETYRVIVDHDPNGTTVAEATVRLDVDGERVIATAQGNGPVNALDAALRGALAARHPRLAELTLSDFKVRILAGSTGTDAVTRVLVSMSDGESEWTTVGVAPNLIEASWNALSDGLAYGLNRR
ncbi:citramalate synthase [Glycomyces harbinensis]|uniref:Citramalate synthase n=1 Tax=Glycomyces harbinensis TaxID=58114 RepID=A0A1G6T0E3_9ACTN|nr:citramalate synthase [Glycomyces harbinensis]SDD22493.1 2-isopropylmalate synthase [Glycomyces harbinensis]